MKLILKLRDLIERILMEFCMILMAAIATLILMQIVLRTIGIGIQWTEEFARFCYVLVTFLGSIMAISRGKHIQITLFLDALAFPLKCILQSLLHLIIAAFCSVGIYGLSRVIQSTRGVVATSVPWFQMNYLYTTVQLGFLLMAVAAVISAVEWAHKAASKQGLEPVEG